MKTRLLILYCLFSFVSLSQNRIFYNADSTLYGFKNAQGKVIAEPRFMMVGNEEFREAVAVIEQVSEEDYSIYYLRADGTRFGVDSVYFFDQSPEVEGNGYLRFKDPVTKKVGVFDSRGKVVFPAEFDEMRPIRNGFIWAIRGAHKECWDEDVPIENCEHSTWVGGEKVLYSINGELLSRNFFEDPKTYANLDYYTFKKSKKTSKDPFRMNFKAEGKGYFSFVNLDLVFDAWIRENWLEQASVNQLRTVMADSVMVWDDEYGWKLWSKTAFLNSGSEELTNLIEELKSHEFDYFNSYEDYFYYDQYPGFFSEYSTGPYNFNHWKYPVYDVIITRNVSGGQSHLTFLRTEQGWKLVSLQL